MHLSAGKSAVTLPRPKRNAALLASRYTPGTFRWTKATELHKEVSPPPINPRSFDISLDDDLNEDASSEASSDLMVYAPSGGARVDPFGSFPIELGPLCKKGH